MEKENLNKAIHVANISSIIIVLTAVVAIIISGFMLAFPRVENINKLTLDYVVEQDSILFQANDSTTVMGLINPEQINRINNNNNLLFKKIDSLIVNYQERHNNVLISNKKQSDFVSFAAVIFAFIVSVAGFFGFKSINEMKKTAIESAEQEARIVSTDQSKITSETIARKTASDITNNYIDKYLLREIQHTAKDTVKEMLSKYDERVTTLENKSKIDSSEEEETEDLMSDKKENNNPFKDEQL